MLVLSSHEWVLGHTTTRKTGTLVFIKAKKSLRIHLKEAQESERSTRVGEKRKKKMKKKKKRRRRVDKDDGEMGPVLENQW